MKHAKITISIDQITLKRVDQLVSSKVFESRSRAFQDAVKEKLSKLDKTRLARECAKLNKIEEKAFVDLGLVNEIIGG